MTTNRRLADEMRVNVLDSLGILDTPAEPLFDELTELASTICQTPISLISLLEYERQWFKSRVGLDVSETSRSVSFCDYAIRGEGVMLVPDATKDDRFSANPLVVGEPHIRFYAGAPLVTKDGVKLGTLCVIDREPRELTSSQLRSLEILSRQVITNLELRHSTRMLVESHQRFIDAVALAEEGEHLMTQSLGALSEGFVVQDTNGSILICNDRACELLGLTREQMCQRASLDPVWHCVREDGTQFPGNEHPAMEALRLREPVKDVVMGVHRSDGSLVWININATPMFAPGKKRVKGVMCTFNDITQRRSVEQEIELQVAELRSVKAELERQHKELEETHRRLEDLAACDGLTGLLNYHMFEKALTKGPARGESLSLMLIHIDEFKDYIDCFGHSAGDDVLRQMAQIFGDTIRQHDYVFRLNDDEFAVLMPIKLDTAKQVAKRLVENVRRTAFELRPLTISVGVSAASEISYDPKSLIECAEVALRRVKREGGDEFSAVNQVSVSA